MTEATSNGGKDDLDLATIAVGAEALWGCNSGTSQAMERVTVLKGGSSWSRPAELAIYGLRDHSATGGALLERWTSCMRHDRGFWADDERDNASLTCKLDVIHLKLFHKLCGAVVVSTWEWEDLTSLGYVLCMRYYLTGRCSCSKLWQPLSTGVLHSMGWRIDLYSSVHGKKFRSGGE